MRLDGRTGTAVAALPRRDQVLIFGSIAGVTVLAWAYMLRLDRQMASGAAYEKAMAAMGMTARGPWTLEDAFFTFAMWAVMMVGMMAVSAAPVILLFAASQRLRPAAGPARRVPIFALGYVAVWGGFSAGATAIQWMLRQSALLSPAMAVSSSVLAGLILAAAGAYQFTPWKGKCLSHCRGPLAFLVTHWRDGSAGAFRMGFHHGLHCLGCCWALMVVLFAVGVMNLVWIAALTLFVLLEKIGPAGTLLARAGGVAMMGFGIYLAAAAL